MGCGSSKLGPEEEAEPPGLHPFRRRINEILQRRNGRSIKDTTPSTKKPLLDEAEDTNSSPTDSLLDDCLKSKSSPESVVSAKGQPPPENDVKEVQEVVKDIEEVQEVSTVKDVVKEVQELSMQEKDVKEVQEVSTPEKDVNEVPRSDKTMGAFAGEQKEREGENVGVKEEDEGEEDNDNDDDDEEDERGSFDGEGAEFAPGSPSFRVYYVPSDDELGEAANGEDKSVDAKGEDKSRRKDSIASLNSSEGSVTKLVKKGNKGRKFRRVLPKGSQVAVKNLLNVKSCYHPSCASAHGKVDA